MPSSSKALLPADAVQLHAQLKEMGGDPAGDLDILHQQLALKAEAREEKANKVLARGPSIDWNSARTGSVHCSNVCKAEVKGKQNQERRRQERSAKRLRRLRQQQPTRMLRSRKRRKRRTRRRTTRMTTTQKRRRPRSPKRRQGFFRKTARRSRAQNNPPAQGKFMIDLLPELKRLQSVGAVLPTDAELKQKCFGSVSQLAGSPLD